MSDEDRDVDIESEEDLEESEDKNSNTQFQTQAEKRAHHNALERKRRDHIKDSFSGLRESIPALQGEKVVKNSKIKSQASRAQILKKAADYIQVMRKKNNIHQQDIDDLKRQNQMLELQIRSLEKNRNSGTYNATNMLDNSPIINSRGNSISAFDGGSGTETSDSESSNQHRRKKLKTVTPVSSSET